MAPAARLSTDLGGPDMAPQTPNPPAPFVDFELRWQRACSLPPDNGPRKRERHFPRTETVRTELGTKAAAGGAIGALIGGLIDYGIPEERARMYDRGVREGGIVMGVASAQAPKASPSKVSRKALTSRRPTRKKTVRTSPPASK